MMKRLLAAALLLCCLTAHATAQTRGRLDSYDGLPRGARVVEARDLPSAGRPGRALLLWMLSPRRHPFEGAADEPYTCPEETRGSYLSGPTRVSLVDARARRVVNTVELRPEYLDGEDSFDLPYRIRRNAFYDVPGGSRTVERRPVIMRLRDYNGDGRAEEFALFDALACMGLQTTLVGYSARQDRVIQYPISLSVEEEGKPPRTEVRQWADYLFSRRPVRPGVWQYEIDYSGRGGTLDRYEIRYNPRAERFEGRAVYTVKE